MGGDVKPLTAFRNAYRRYYRDNPTDAPDRMSWGAPRAWLNRGIGKRHGYGALGRHDAAIKRILDTAEQEAWCEAQAMLSPRYPKMADAVAGGKSKVAVAREFGCSWDTVNRACKQRQAWEAAQ